MNKQRENCSTLSRSCDGNNAMLVFQQGMEQMLKQAIMKMMQLFFPKQPRLSVKIYAIYTGGSFPPGCQQESVPTNLKSLVAMLLNGPNLMNQDSTDSQICLTTILFNYKKRWSSVTNKSRHSLDYEPPLPFNIHWDEYSHANQIKEVDRTVM